MRLRARVLAATMAVLTPAMAALIALDGASRHSEAARVLAAVTHDRVGRSSEACSADPRAWEQDQLAPPDRGDAPPPPRGPHKLPPPVVHTFDAHGLPTAGAPAPLPPDVARRAAAGEDVVTPAWWWSSEVEVTVAGAPGGPCAIVRTRGATTPGWLGSILPEPAVWATPMAAVIAVVLAALGPIITRIRRLGSSVRGLAAAGWQVDLDASGDDELADLARAFRDAAAAVRAEMAGKDARERALRQHLEDTSHDLMLPLTVLQGHLAALRARDASPEVTEAMDEAHYLGGIVRNLAAAARLQATRADDALDLVAVVERVAARHRPVARPRGIQIEHAVPEGPVPIRGDTTLIEQAISNVVYNAVRHHPGPGNVAVVLDADRGGFTLRVLDDGPGVDGATLARLGDRGFRGDPARGRAPEGLGLGLNITRRVADAHGWALAFARGAGGGLEVTLQGPLAA